jgi:hypothetical protein
VYGPCCAHCYNGTCVCVDKLDLGFSMAFVRHGFMNSVLEEMENCKFLAVTCVAKRFVV